MPKKVKLPLGVRFLVGGYVNLKRKQRLSLKSADGMVNVRATKAGKDLKMAYQRFVQVGTTTFRPTMEVTMEHFKDGKWVECKYRVIKGSGGIRVWAESGGKSDYNDCLTEFRIVG